MVLKLHRLKSGQSLGRAFDISEPCNVFQIIQPALHACSVLQSRRRRGGGGGGSRAVCKRPSDYPGFHFIATLPVDIV